MMLEPFIFIEKEKVMTTIQKVGGDGPFSISSLKHQAYGLKRDLVKRNLEPHTRRRAEATLLGLLMELKKHGISISKRKSRVLTASKTA